MSEREPRRRILIAALGSLALAVVILITFVLPAEYGWDPLGTGELLGLKGFSGAGKSPLTSQQVSLTEDALLLELAPFESVEYKYRLEAGAALVYTWHSSGEVLFEMHSVPDGAAPGYAETFSKGRGLGNTGSYTAPYAGIHGWYWQNRGQRTITVSLRAEGFFDHAVEFRDGREMRREFSAERAEP